MTIEQLQAFVDTSPDLRQLVNAVVDYIQSNPSSGQPGQQGVQGIQGEQGIQGIPGQAGIAGTSNAMQAGTVTVNTAAVTADSKIFLSHASPIGTLGWLTPGTIIPGVSFVINSTGATDLSTVNWLIIN